MLTEEQVKNLARKVVDLLASHGCTVGGAKSVLHLAARYIETKTLLNRVGDPIHPPDKPNSALEVVTGCEPGDYIHERPY
jgi:hypothetical protein